MRPPAASTRPQPVRSIEANNAYDINPGSSHLRLAKPGTTATDSVEVPSVVGKHRGAAREALEAAGLRLAGDGDGIAATQSPAPGEKLAPGASVQVSFVPGPSPASDREYQVSIALNTSLADDNKRDSVRLLLSALANAVDDGASHIQFTVKATVTDNTRDEVMSKAQAAGAHATTTEI
jgi:hypothetical protein